MLCGDAILVIHLETGFHVRLGTVPRRGRAVSGASGLARRAAVLLASLGTERCRGKADGLAIELAG